MINFANDFELFNNKNLGSVRTALDQDGNIWFVAKDVCDVLGIVNNRDAMSRLDEDEKDTIDPHIFTVGNTDTENRRGSELSIINESGMYTLVLTSRKPQAKEFKKWLTHEVIPTIRQHGGYIYGQEMLETKDQKEIKEKLSELSEKIKYLRVRRRQLRKQVSNLQENKRKLRKQVNNLNEYADLYEDLFEKAQADYVAAMEENEYLRDKVEKLRYPEDYPAKSEASQKYFVMSDGRVSFAGKEDLDFER